jgi:hypothetical protein
MSHQWMSALIKVWLKIMFPLKTSNRLIHDWLYPAEERLKKANSSLWGTLLNDRFS